MIDPGNEAGTTFLHYSHELFLRHQSGEASRMGNSSSKSESAAEFPPEKRLEAPNTRLIDAGIATIPDMEILRERVDYENVHQNRTQILKQLEWKAAELRED